MPEPQPAWMLEPHVRHFFAGFPLPLALLRADGGVVAVNEEFDRALDRSSLESSSVQGFVADADAGNASVGLVRKGGGEALLSARALRDDDNVLLVLSERPLDGLGEGEAGSLRERVEQLERLVATDRLTGVWNRAHFDRMIELELARSERYRQPVALVLLDIDHFKRINDTHGHPVGDAVLCELVHAVRERMRVSDLLFRWGGEEFAVLAPSTNHRTGAILAEKLRHAVETHAFPLVGRVTASLGVAERLAGETAPAWMRRVDEQLYSAKRGGRNRVVADARGCSEEWAAADRRAIIRLNWSESYACGESTIDAQHRELFDRANRLVAAAFVANQDRPAFDVALDGLLDHVARHFADEEAILAGRGYPQVDNHRRLHAALLDRAARLKTRCAAGDVPLGELVEFLAHDVVARHMLAADREFFSLFGTPGAPRS